MLKLVFAGTPDVAVPSLQAFAADSRFEVVGVITVRTRLLAVVESSRRARSKPQPWSLV